MLEVLNKTEILQLCFGAYILALNRCDIYVKNVLDDSSDQSLINLAAQAEAGPSEVSLPITAVDTLCLTPPTPTLIVPFSASFVQMHPSSSSSYHSITSCKKKNKLESSLPQTKSALTFTDPPAQNM
jgi:hypothetical protein